MDDSEGKMEIDTSNRSVSLINCIASYVFRECIQNQEGENDPKLFNYRWDKIYKQIELESENMSELYWSDIGLLGPQHVDFDRKRSVGSITYKNHPLQICSKDNFSTAFANTCVLKGKWQYETMLGSKGVMQIGWATLNCQFSQENGVGDTLDSYAYDGNRQRKWNISTLKYGDVWHSGDVITCLIDLDVGEISYLRNGMQLGLAFSDIKLGDGIAYFPAISLSMDENLLVNFGTTPFHHPQDGYNPLIRPAIRNSVLATTCLRWIARLAHLKATCSQIPDLLRLEQESGDSKETSMLIICHHIGSQLSNLLNSPFVVESALIPQLDYFTQGDGLENVEKLKFAHTFLDCMMSILQEDELKAVTANVIQCIEYYMKSYSSALAYPNQRRYLKILKLMLSHNRLRIFLLKYVLFENARFVTFTCLKPIDKQNLTATIKIDFFSSKNGEFIKGNREAYLQAVRSIEESVQDIKQFQMNNLELMMTREENCSYNETSRAIFLSKFRLFLKEQWFDKRNSSSMVTIIPSQMLILFHQCFDLFQLLWKKEVGELNSDSLTPHLFYDGEVSFYETCRLGGLESHLRKRFASALKLEKTERSCDMAASTSDKTEMIDDDEKNFSGIVLGNNSRSDAERKIEASTAFLEFLDGIVLLYHHGGHKHITKMIAESNSLFDNVSYYEKLISKKEKSIKNEFSSGILKELDRSMNVMEQKIVIQSYQHAWSLATHFSSASISKLILILKLIQSGLKNASNKGNLFAFVPEYYIEIVSELCLDLRYLINSTDGNESCDELRNYMKVFRPGGFEINEKMFIDYVEVLTVVSELLSIHFCDSRIVDSDSKDAVTQALAGMVCHKLALKALESSPIESRLHLVKSLLKPYENRAWAQNNWILVRFWKGKGFGFRYTKSPHLVDKLGPKPAYCDIPNIIQSTVPCPSNVFLAHLYDCLQDTEISSAFLNSLLNQLNWVFSEFIGMMQEIQNASNRPERVFIESRQLRICATCFDLTLALLRVLEMTVSISPNIFIDSERSNSQALLSRLCQLLCQILNRVSIGDGCFSHVVNLDIPGLETVHYYPILTSVAGILCQLLASDVYSKNGGSSLATATNALLNEPSFQISTVYILIGGKENLKSWVNDSLPMEDEPSGPSNRVSFPYCEEPNDANCSEIASIFMNQSCNCKFPKICLRNYDRSVKSYEIRKIVDVIYYLETVERSLTKSTDSDSICTICYANTKDAKFLPCNHTSCTTCITHYLMNRKSCFFCKADIERVVSLATSEVIVVVPAGESMRDDINDDDSSS